MYSANEMKFKIFQTLLAGLICIGVFQAYQMVPSHFTQIDDIGVAESLMIRNLDYRDNCELNLPTIQGKVFSLIYADKEKVCKKLVQFNRLTIIPSLWTYAPVQFWFTQALLQPNTKYSYEEVKWRGRLPSFIFYVLGTIGFYWMLLKSDLGFRGRSSLALAMTAMIAFSLEERIYAAQMHSYAIGVLANVLIIWSLFSLRDIENKSLILISMLALCIALGVGMQYQGMLLAMAGLLAIGFNAPVQFKNQSFAIRYAYLVALLTGLIYLVVGNIFGMSSRAINWNAGPHGEFIVQGNGWQERGIDFIRLITSYSAENIYAITSAIELEHFGAQIFGGVILILCLLGVMYLCLRAKDARYRFILLFISIYLSAYFSLVILGKLTFSPTRHLLYFLPMVVLLWGYGIIFIFSLVLLQFRWITQVLLGSVLLLYLVGSIALFDRFHEQRIDHIKENYFSKLASESDASFLIFDGNDIEPLFLADNRMPKYWYASGGFSCSHMEMLIPSQKKLNFFFYSKERVANLEDARFIQYVNDIIGHCTTHSTKDKKIIKISQVAKVIDRDGIAVEFGNNVTNVRNNTFIQLFEIQTNFSSNLYPATLEQGIDFSQKSYPRFLKFVSGLAGAEAWGRWSDANQGKQIYLGFKDSLPNQFTLELTAQSYGENSQYPTLIRIGNQVKTLVIGNDLKTYQIDFDFVQEASVIEITPPRPAPVIPYSGESRRLGIGLVKLSIKTH
jgi:hypothetical protein